MKEYLKHDEWKIIEDSLQPDYNRISESIMSIGNGRFGQRANFEEDYSGDTLPGNYIAGVYYPDKTRVGWWKNGYPEYFAKVLNGPNWIGLHVVINGERLDLAKCTFSNYRAELDMRHGILSRKVDITTVKGTHLVITSERFCSIADDEIGAMSYHMEFDATASVEITPYIDGDVINEDSNYDEKFWVELSKGIDGVEGYVNMATKKTDFHVCTAMKYDILHNGDLVDGTIIPELKEKYAGSTVEVNVEAGDTIHMYKYAAILSSLNHEKNDLVKDARQAARRAHDTGYYDLKDAQCKAWEKKWEEADIVIEGDVAAQQGIRFNIFQLYQTYTGEDARLNIGPKGFTGEKYGGSTYWDTEAYCLPFYLATADDNVAKNLLLYRYRQLDKAIENAEKLGFTGGAALFPMVTMNGEECHNEWEITFEEIHRNGAIAYAVYDYINFTGDRDYLADYGLELLIAISRFWAQRVHFAESKKQYVMHGVTGPNEYENNVNNNWYTLYIARWCMQYTAEAIAFVKETAPEKYRALSARINFDEAAEVGKWQEICDKLYLPEDAERGIFVQHDGFLDKELVAASKLGPDDYPICQNWSWDRILRSCYIKQADVLQGLYLFEEHFDDETIKRNFEFYEPMTVHESSLSPCVHAILAGKVGLQDKAYEMYLRTARLDLDDYNNDTEDGCHITSMAGTWMAFVKGFGGMRVREGQLYFSPYIPDKWKSYAFHIRFKGHLVEVKVTHNEVVISNKHDEALTLFLNGKDYEVAANGNVQVEQ
jgi:maltose phosphorylase